MGAVFLIAVDAGAYFFSRQGEWHEYDPSVHAAYAIAAVGEGVYLQLQLWVVLKWVGYKAAGRGIQRSVKKRGVAFMGGRRC